MQLGSCGVSGEAGAPMLPVVRYDVLLPPGAANIRVELAEAHWKTLDGPWRIDPAPPAVASGSIVDWGPSAGAIVDGHDLSIYGVDAEYPAEPVELASVGDLRAWRLAEVRVHLAVYNPVRESVRVLRGGRVDVRFDLPVAAPPAAQTITSVEERFLGGLVERVVNPQDLEAFYPPIPPADQEQTEPPAFNDYVIVTRNHVVENSRELGTFVALKQMQGYSVKVVTEAGTPDATHYQQGSSENETANNIRSWLRSRYLSEGIQYVLLIGVPYKYCCPRAHVFTDMYIGANTDMYYAELTGSTWDKDNDGQAGEFRDDFGSGGADKYCELQVGRMPSWRSGTRYSMLDAILRKTMSYTLGQGGLDWRRKLLVAAAISNFGPQDSNGDGDSYDTSDFRYSSDKTFGTDWGEALKGKAQDVGDYAYTLYEKTGCKDNGSAYSLTPCSAPLTADNLVDAWEHGYGFATWWGHGNPRQASRFCWTSDVYHEGTCNKPTETQWRPLFTESMCPQLNDYRPSFVVQVSCLNGSPSTKNLAESLLHQGAIGTFAGTSVTWYRAGSWSTGQGDDYADNASFGYWIYKRMAEDGDTAGAALNWCRSHFGTDWSSGASWMNMLAFTLHGDPSIGLRTAYLNLPPLPPTELQARQIPGQVHLTWRDNSRNETGFWIQYRTVPAPWPNPWYVLGAVPADVTSYQYTYPSTGTYEFRVYAVNENGSSPYSNADSIDVMPLLQYVSVSTPNGGESLIAGQQHTIRWTSGFSPPSRVHLDYSTDSGTTWNAIAWDVSNLCLGECTYAWTVPNVSSGQCLVRVSDTDGWPYDLSDAPFTITPRPDLVVERVELDPPWPTAGSPCTVTVAVRNQGLATSSPVWIDGFTDCPGEPEPGRFPDWSMPTGSIMPGRTQRCSKAITFGSTGRMRPYVVLDADNALAESDESNNTLRPGAFAVIDVEVRFEKTTAYSWFGGDDREDFKPRNVGVGQQIVLGRTTWVCSVGFCFADMFDYEQAPEGFGHEVTLVLDVRTVEGYSLQRVTKAVDASFRSGWLVFDLDTELFAGVPYVFTCYLQEGQTNELSNSVVGHKDEDYAHTQGYRAIGYGAGADLDDGLLWEPHPWEFNVLLRGYRTDGLQGDLDEDQVVSVYDLWVLAEHWTQTDCLWPEGCGVADLSGDRRIDMEDLAILAARYRQFVYPYDYWNKFRIAIYEGLGHLSAQPIDGSDGQDLWPGTQMIYKTNEGRYGRCRVQAYDPATKRLTLEWITYNDNGTPYSSGQGLSIAPSYTVDLDAGTSPGGAGADAYWNTMDAATRYWRSSHGATFMLVLRAQSPY